MTDLITLMIITVALAWCADHVSFGPVNPNKRHRLILCTLIILVLLAGFAGLRTYCNDTGAYKHAYELITDSTWENANKSIGANPLFNWINQQLHAKNVSTQNFLMFWAFLTVGCYIIFVQRYSVNYPLTIFLLFTTGCYTFAFAGIKQAAAVGIAVIAVMFALKKKWIPFVLLVLVAALIHPYALMYLLVPFAQFKPWSKKTYIMLVAFIAAGLLLRPLIGTVINITTLLGEEYTVEEFSQEGVNIFRVLVCNVPLLLSFIYRQRLFENSSKAENLTMNLTMLNGAIMFVGLFGTANYFARLANYFLIFQSLSLPWLLRKIGGKDGRILTILMVVGYIAYFYYENAINQPFDQNFARLTVWQYLNQLGG
jgi:hypothetical protein